MSRDERRDVVWKPLGIWAALLLLLATTLGYAYLPGAPAKLVVGLAIGTAKALLVAWFFMRLSRAPGLVRMAAVAGLVWASFLYLFAFSDYLTR